MNDSILTALTRTWMTHLLRNCDPYVSASSIEEDGRKRVKALKEAISEGFLTVTERSSGAVYFATSKAYDATEATKPDLTTVVTLGAKRKWDIERTHGLPFDSLTIGERKFIVEHRADYTFLESVGMGDVRPYDFDVQKSYGRGDIIVQDEAFRKVKAEALYDARFEQAYKTNLAWGLVQLGIIAPVDADVFKARDEDAFAFSAASFVFGSEPEKWSDDAGRGVITLREQIAKATRAANVLIEAQMKIQLFGGWAAVLTAYKAKITEALAKEDATSAEKASTLSVAS